MNAHMNACTRYTISTRKAGDGSDACYVVYFYYEMVATFPVNDPNRGDAKEYAERFAAMMNAHIEGLVLQGL